MRMSRNQIRALSREIVDEAVRQGLVRLGSTAEEAASVVEKELTEDLMVEDRLGDEVREILKQYQREIDRGSMDYNTMFELVKKKLARERGLIL